MRRPAALLLAVLAAALGHAPRRAAAQVVRPAKTRTNSLAENAKQCIFAYQGSGQKYMYSLQGLASPSGYYSATQPVGAVAYTFWFQFCGNMQLSRVDPGRPGVACSRVGVENNCPKSCRDARTHTCGDGCAAIMAQKLPGRKHSKCWSVGQWGDGRKVSVSLLDPGDPTQGIVYTMLQGDTKGCPGSIARTLSLAIRCPGVGMPVVPVLNVSSLGNCAYAATMAHPAACPLAPGALPRRDQRLSYSYGYGNGASGYAGGPPGSTAQTLGGVATALAGAFALYCVLGVAWRVGVLGARGADALPHAALWRDLPGACARAAAAAAEEARGVLLEAGSGVPDDMRDEPRVPLLRRQ